MTRKSVQVLIAALLFSGASVVEAAFTPLQISIWDPVQVFPADWSVVGVRANILHGVNARVYGLDIGLLSNRTTSSGGGLSIAMINGAWGESLGGFVGLESFVGQIRPSRRRHDNGCTYVGAQLGVFNGAESLYGMQFGSVNVANYMNGIQIGHICNRAGNVNGIQLASFANRADGNVAGLQLSQLFNICDGTVNGGQISVVNITKNLNGFQLGLVNIVKDSSVRFMPLCNVQF
jgi:hypothetical protein